MRLVRLGATTSQVGDDVRAALASWGRGDTVVGGVALLGCQPPGCPSPVEAIVILPRGVLVIAGVDLPGAAVSLDAPLSGAWKTDGWPLVRPDGAVNPAVEAIKAADAVAKHLQTARVEPLPVGTVVAIGPYVSKVTQPTADLMRGVRILHPEPMNLITAAKELAVYERRCTIERAREVIAALSDQSTLATADLLSEGFSDVVSQDMSIASTNLIPRITDEPRPSAPPRARRSGIRWLPIAAVALVGVLLIGGIVVAISSSSGDPAPPTATPTSSQAPGSGQQQPGTQAQPAGTDAEFAAKGSLQDADCAARASGDVQVWLRANGCDRLVRARFQATTGGRKAAVLVASLAFPTEALATQFRATADTPGAGGILDAPADATPWPEGITPSFQSAAYASGVSGTTARTVQAVWLDGGSSVDDPTLIAVARRALDIDMPG